VMPFVTPLPSFGNSNGAGFLKSFSHLHFLSRTSIVLLALVIAPMLTRADTRIANHTGYWNDPATWVDGIIPNSTDDVLISSGAVVSLNTQQQCLQVVIQDNATLVIVNQSGSLAVSNSVLIGGTSSAGTLTMDEGSLNADGLTIKPTGELIANGGIIHLGYAAPSVPAATYYNLSLFGGDKTAEGDITVKGDLIISSSTTFSAESYSHKFKGDVIVSVVATFDTAMFLGGTSTVTLSGNSEQILEGKITFNNVEMSNGPKTTRAPLTIKGSFTVKPAATFNAGSFTHVIKGDCIINGALVSDSGTIQLNSSSPQAIVGNTPFHDLELRGSGLKTATGPLTVEGSFTIDPLASFDAGSFNHVLKGNFLNYGSFSPSLSKITMKGSTLQSILGGNTFHDLTINNSSGVRFLGADPDTVHGTLRFLEGDLMLGPKDLEIGSNAFVVGAGTGKCIITNGTGRVRRKINGGTGAGNFQFPVGPEKGTFNPVLMTLQPSASEPAELFSVSVNVLDERAPGFGTIDSSLHVRRIWDIKENTVGGNHANLTFSWLPQEDGSGVHRSLTDPVSVRIYMFDSVTSHYEFVDSAIGPAPGSGTIVASTAGFHATSFGFHIIGEQDPFTSVGAEHSVPRAFTLGQNYPNPFNPTTNISFDLPSAGDVMLKVYDMLGREVATLVNEARPAGRYTERFNATGRASGVYLYRLTTPLHSATKKLTLVR